MKLTKADLGRARRRYRALKGRCEARVERWEWATTSAIDPRPFYHERNELPRGRVLKGRPGTIKRGTHAYGFDAEGRVVVVRQYTEFRGRMYEEFLTYAGRVV